MLLARAILSRPVLLKLLKLLVDFATMEGNCSTAAWEEEGGEEEKEETPLLLVSINERRRGRKGSLISG